jgi:hypothetical protein
MQQNKYKDSVWAKKARTGYKISWAMELPTWIRIDEETINPPKTTANDTATKQSQSSYPTSISTKKPKTDRDKGRRGFWT